MGNNNLKEKLRFVIKTLTDKDAAFTLMAYNQLKQRKLMLEGVGFGDDVATKLKIRLLRKLTDTGYNLQVMGVNAVKEYLESERDREERERRVRKTTKRKGQNPKKNHERQPKNDGYRIQTSPTMDCLCQRCRKSSYRQTKRYHEKNR